MVRTHDLYLFAKVLLTTGPLEDTIRVHMYIYILSFLLSTTYVQ